MLRPLAALLCWLALCAPLDAAGGEVLLATLEWPPYIGQDLPGQGYVAEVAREAFARSGHEARFRFLPWKRTVEETRAGRFHAYLPEYFAYGLLDDFVLSTPFPGGPLALLTTEDRDIDASILERLSPYRIGVVRGYVNTREFDEADFLNKQAFADDLTSLKMLLRGRVDLAVMDLNVARHLAAGLPGAGERIKALSPFLGVRNLYLCFPKSRPDHLELLADFDAGLASMIADGSLESIARRHGLGPDAR